jgi:hypothetical protein
MAAPSVLPLFEGEMSIARRVLVFAALWLLFEGAISWMATCEPPSQAATNYSGKENHCTFFAGPIVSIIRFGAANVFSLLHAYEKQLVAGFTIVLAAFTGTLWWSTRKLWRVTNDTLTHARESSEHQLRPYVQIATMTFQWDLERGVRIIGECVNSGQSPATFFEIGCVSAVVDRGGDLPDTIPADLDCNTWVSLAANGKETVALPIPSDDAVIDANSVHESTGKKSFLILGRVRYGDVFGNEYETEFLYFTQIVEPGRVRKMSRAPARLRTYQKTKSSRDG